MPTAAATVAVAAGRHAGRLFEVAGHGTGLIPVQEIVTPPYQKNQSRAWSGRGAAAAVDQAQGVGWFAYRADTITVPSPSDTIVLSSFETRCANGAVFPALRYLRRSTDGHVITDMLLAPTESVR